MSRPADEWPKSALERDAISQPHAMTAWPAAAVLTVCQVRGRKAVARSAEPYRSIGGLGAFASKRSWFLKRPTGEGCTR
jgi:hypothetical protein